MRSIMIERISINPNVCHGKPVVDGTRILVSNILGALASGDSIETILQDYPNITKEDIQAALHFGSSLSNYESFPYDIKAS